MSKDRFGVLPFWRGYDRKLYLKAAQLADELGYDSFWTPEVWGYEIFTLLTEVAQHTKHIKLGTGIVNVFSRSPALLAMSAATLDEISEGRLMLGIGTSGKRVIEGFHAREFKKPLSQWKDVVRVVRAALGGVPLHEAGATLNEYRPFKLDMKLPRRQVPIYVAALKPKSITTIGELADGWIPTFWPYRKLEEGRKLIAEGAARAGRDPSEITIAPFTNVMPTGKEQGGRFGREIIAFYVGGMGEYYRELLEGFGYQEECAKIADLYQDKATRSQAADAVSDEMLEALSIVGSPEQCIAELRRRREFGLQLPIINLPTGLDWPQLEGFLKALAPNQ